MRKILVMATLIIGIISCGKDETDAITGDYPEIVGTWKVVDGEVNGKRTSQDSDLTYEDRQTRDCAGRSTFKFLANGDFRGTFYQPRLELEYTNGVYKFAYKGCQVAIDLDEMADTEGTIKYKIEGKKIIMHFEDDEESYDEHLFNIESLSGKTLKVSYSEEMKEQVRSDYERSKRMLQQYNLEMPENIDVALNGFIIMEKQ